MYVHRIALIIGLGALAACGQPDNAAETEPAPVVEAVEPTPPDYPLQFPSATWIATSRSATALTGDATIHFRSISFVNNIELETSAPVEVPPEVVIREGGPSFAEAAAASASAGGLAAELREIYAQRINADLARKTDLCGAGVAPTHLAIVYDTPISLVRMVVFSGADRPGPEARDSAVCATFTYAAP